MNQLPLHKRVMILKMLVEGVGMRPISRTVGVSINTVTKLLVDAGFACADFHDSVVRGIHARRIECDEIWAFCHARKKNVTPLSPDYAGDVWTWIAIEADNRLITSYDVGDRSINTAYRFMRDLRGRVVGRPQLNTDAWKAYYMAIKAAFGPHVDYAQLVKVMHDQPNPAGKTGEITKAPIFGDPNMEEVSTSYVERHNLSLRMGIRRFTRKTNGHSKKLQNHFLHLALHTVYHNFVKELQTLDRTPAMAAGITTKPYDMEWIVGLIDARQAKPKRPANYRKVSN